VSCDVADEDDVIAAVAAASEITGALQYCVASAGTGTLAPVSMAAGQECGVPESMPTLASGALTVATSEPAFAPWVNQLNPVGVDDRKKRRCGQKRQDILSVVTQQALQARAFGQLRKPDAIIGIQPAIKGAKAPPQAQSPTPGSA